MSDSRVAKCWCGNDRLAPFSAEYSCCDACNTLVFAGEPAQADPRVRDDASDFYGRDYFFGRQQQGNRYPTIATRARTDLHERCAYWLNALTRYKLPPARVLELGSAHGGFTALLKHAGYNATGLDLSPAIVEMAIQNFDVPILVGPIEDQSIAPGSLDAIVLMDVIEHMPQPRETMAHCLSLLKPDGVIMLQTPCFPGKTLDQIQRSGDRFAEQFKPGEHLNLFSKQSIATLFSSIGAAYIQFLPPIFWFYDMFCIVSRQPLVETLADDRAAAFTSNVNARFVQALLDGEDRFRGLLEKHRTIIAENAALKRELAMALQSASMKRSA